VLDPRLQISAGVDDELQFQSVLGDGCGVAAERQSGVVVAG
jgi:hypothetical protein